MIEIKVKDCYSCPFAEIDDEYGDSCNARGGVNLVLSACEMLPQDKVHELCPLKENSISVSIENVD
jgi:hypothetical protein